MDAALNWLWQGCAVAVALGVLRRGLGRTRANVRYVVSWAALGLILSLPGLAWLTAVLRQPSAATFAQNSAVVVLPDSWWTSSVVMFAAWGAWVAVSGYGFVVALIALGRARAQSRVFPTQVESTLPQWQRVGRTARRATLVLSDAVPTAGVLGCGSPVIAVSPSLVQTLDANALDRVLIHEWAHVQRRDDIVHLLQVAVGVLVGWHPAVWYVDRCLHIEREIACDEMAVALTGTPTTYAECLLKLADIRDSGRRLLAPAVFGRSGLRARITALVVARPSMGPMWARSLAATAIVTLATAALGVCGLTLVDATPLVLPFESVRIMRAAANAPAAILPPVPARAMLVPSRRPVAPPSARADRPAVQRPVDAPSTSTTPTGAADSASTRSETARDAASDAVSDGATEARVTEPGADARTLSTVADTLSPALPPASAAAAPTAAADGAPRSPWAEVDDRGVDVGRKSRDAGVATAGAFSRFARRVARSF